MKSKVKDEFFIRFRGADGPLDVVNALRGNDIFYDFYDEEEGLLGLHQNHRCNNIHAEEAAENITEYKDVISGFDVIVPKGYAGIFRWMRQLCCPMRCSENSKFRFLSDR